MLWLCTVTIRPPGKCLTTSSALIGQLVVACITEVVLCIVLLLPAVCLSSVVEDLLFVDSFSHI